MKFPRRWAALLALSSGTMLQSSSCDNVFGAILNTISLAFGIVDTWV